MRAAHHIHCGFRIDTLLFDLSQKANTSLGQHNDHIFLRKPNLELEKKHVKK